MGYCVLTPKVTVGDKAVDSSLYIGLSDRIKDKPLTNLVYASYLQPKVALELDQMGKKRNKQGQHIAIDVFDFFDVNKMLNEKTDTIKAIGNYHIKDEEGEYIIYPFSEGKQLLDAVHVFNSTEVNHNKRGIIATLIRRNDGYSILVDKRTSQTQKQVAEVRKNSQLLDLVEAKLKESGISLEELLQDPNIAPFINVNDIQDFFNVLNLTKKTNNKYLGSNIIALLLSLNKEDARIETLKKFFKVGNIKDLAISIDEALNTPRESLTIPEGRLTTIHNLLDTSKEVFKGKKLSLLDIINNIHKETSRIIEFDEEFSLLHTLEELDKEFHIEDDVIELSLDNINSLEKFAFAALRNLRKKASQIEKLQGVTPEVKRLNAKAQELSALIEGKQLYAGSLRFLKEVYNDLNEIIKLKKEYNSFGDNNLMETIHKRSKLIMNMDRKIHSNITILEIINKRPEIFIQEGLTKEELKELQKIVKELLPVYQNLEGFIEKASKNIFIDASLLIFGENAFNMASGQIAELANKNGSLYDFLYSMSEMSDPHAALLGAIMRRASDKKEAALAKIKTRIDRANRIYVKKSGTRSTDFMYDKESNQIISDINWKEYNKARSKYLHELKGRGITGINLKVEIEAWESANLEERVVDKTNGRTERVPNEKYRKPFPQLTEAQQEYYDTIMQIKGEIDSLFPEEARHYYRPPQIRRSTWDALKAASRRKDKTTYWKVIENSARDLFTIREDDTNFSSSGTLISGEGFSIGRGDITGEIEKNIPTYYINNLVDQNELIKDFSSALLHLASAAIQYNIKQEIKDTAEVISMYSTQKNQSATNNKGKKLAETFRDGGKTVVVGLTTGNQDLSNVLIEGLVDTHIYGKRYTEDYEKSKLAKLGRTGLAFNSLLNLGVNVLGAASNVLTGESNILIEAGAGEFFNLKDYVVAKGNLASLLFTLPQKAADLYTDTVENKDSLISIIFDPFSDSFSELHGSKRYNQSFVEKLLSCLTGLPLYAGGEWMLRKTVMYAVLHNEKVLLDGKKISLYKALDKSEKIAGSSELVFKEGVTDLQGNPLTSIDSEYVENIKRKVRAANNSIHGAMNQEDKGLIHRYFLGRAVMQFRQWMVAFYGKRFRTTPYWDDNMKKMRRGYYAHILYQLNRLRKLENETLVDILKSQVKDKDLQYDIRRALTDGVLIIAFQYLAAFIYSNIDDDDNDDKNDIPLKLTLYQVLRTQQEIKSGNLSYALVDFSDFWSSILTILNNPIPQTKSLYSTAYMIQGLYNGDLFEEIEDGKYKGETKYFRTLWNDLPPRKQIRRLYDPEAIENLLNSFDLYKELQGDITAIPTDYNYTDSDGDTYPVFLHKITKGKDVGEWTCYIERVSEETGEPYKYFLPNGIEIAAQIQSGELETGDPESLRSKPKRPKRPDRPKRPQPSRFSEKE